jgi:hypothetical protein
MKIKKTPRKPSSRRTLPQTLNPQVSTMNIPSGCGAAMRCWRKSIVILIKTKAILRSN